MNEAGRRRAETTDPLLRIQVAAIFGRRGLQSVRPPIPRVFSHYELQKRIGTGANGTVYLARDRSLDRRVAIKVLRKPLYNGRESRERFFREAKCAFALNHPNIVTVHELGHDHGTDFVVMEYVPGKTLAQATPKRGLHMKVCLDYALQIAGAVAAAHSRGIAHRDLKPSNFVIATDGTVKLLDFGLAKVVASRNARESGKSKTNESETGEGTILGTAGYMSPEQVRGEKADRRSDIFSSGAVFYELLTGRRAFQENSAVATMSAILHKAPQKLPACVPIGIAKIVSCCLEKEPARRYKSATDLFVALTCAADSLAVKRQRNLRHCSGLIPSLHLSA